MLHQRAAHSLDTWKEDELMPLNPAISRKGPGSLISKGMMAAIVGYKVSCQEAYEYEVDYVLRPLSWIPPQLEALEINTETPIMWNPKMDYENCPCLPALRRLRLADSETYLPERLSPLFPNIEELELNLTAPPRFESNQNLVNDLASLQKLKLLKVCARELIDVPLPPGCQVVFLVTNSQDFMSVSFQV